MWERPPAAKDGRPVLVFDLDGTLSDRFGGIWRSLNYAIPDALAPLRRAGFVCGICTSKRRAFESAHANGLRAVGVAWGSGSAAELNAAPPCTVCRSPAELTEWLIAHAPVAADAT